MILVPDNTGNDYLDDEGNLIGIVNAKHVGADNASYAIKSNSLKTVSTGYLWKVPVSV